MQIDLSLSLWFAKGLAFLRHVNISVAFVVSGFLLLVINLHAYAQEELRVRANVIFGQIPEKMRGSENDTREKVRLGERLYFEKALSINRTLSCNSCHNLLYGGAGVDNLKTSVGALGIVGRRNTPSTWNAGFQFAQNWDASASTLAEQARSPILDPSEMALPSEKEAIKRLRKIGYKKQFKLAFPEQANALNFENITLALAAFQRTLVTKDRFDEFLNGDDKALTSEEKSGLELVLSQGCISCHSGPLMGGRFVMEMGLVNPYANTEDKGRSEITGNEAQDFFFKVPSLRNTAQTAPYFHDGEGENLEKAVFDTGWLQLGIKLTEKEVSEISAFLRALDNTRPFKRQLTTVN